LGIEGIVSVADAAAAQIEFSEKAGQAAGNGQY
jgi:hypothetical protein